MERQKDGEGEVKKRKTSVAGGVGRMLWVGAFGGWITHTPNHASAERAKWERVGGRVRNVFQPGSDVPAKKQGGGAAHCCRGLGTDPNVLIVF